MGSSTAFNCQFLLVVALAINVITFITIYAVQEMQGEPAPETLLPVLAPERQPYISECLKNKIEWETYLTAAREKNDPIVKIHSQKLIDMLTKFVMLDPVAPANETCKPALPVFDPAQCANHPDVFRAPREAPARMAHMIQLGFDVDTLEIHLHEIYDVVDRIFIIESTVSHYKAIRKPLMWELLSQTPRFHRFVDKVVHFVLDDSESISKPQKENMWGLEWYQEEARWKRFLDWNAETKEFADTDVIGFGDADEIPNRHNLMLLKHCHFDDLSVDVGTLFLYGTVERHFVTDYPIRGHRFFLGEPTFYTLEKAKANGEPTRQRGKSPKFLLGGAHLTHNGYLPFQLLKSVTCTECSLNHMDGLYRGLNNITELETGYAGAYWEGRLFKSDEIKEELGTLRDMLPWFLMCNPERFPRWFDQPDPRSMLPANLVPFEC